MVLNPYIGVPVQIILIFIYTGILSIFSTQIRNNNSINVFEDGKESRDFVYIDDVVNATYLCLNENLTGQFSLNVNHQFRTCFKYFVRVKYFA